MKLFLLRLLLGLAVLMVALAIVLNLRYGVRLDSRRIR